MKKKSIIARVIGCGLVMGTFLAACSAQEGSTNTTAAPTEAPAATEASTETTGTTETPAGGELVGMANPWRTCTEEEAKEACPRLFQAPDGAVVNGWSLMEAGADESGVPGPIVQMDGRLDGMDFTARAKNGAKIDEDIAGMYYTWDVTDDVTLANWGMGNMQGKVMRHIDDNGWTIDLCTWYDVEIGIAYSLSVEGADLDGFDIQAVAEQMYCAENEPFGNMPDVVEDGQNPVMNVMGQYYAGRGNLSITPEGTNGALIEVWWGSSAWEHSEWVMHGTMDSSTGIIEYSDCERHDYTVKDDGTVDTDVTAYTNGTGRIVINDDYSITWFDDQDHIADDVKMTN